MSAEPSTSPLRVLVADDRRDASRVMQVLLERAGHQVVVAEDLETALRLAQEHRPSVVISDIALETARDGCKLARWVRGEDWVPRPLLIAVTGYDDDQTRRDATEAGFDHFLVKPTSIQQLLAILATAPR